MLPKRTPAHLPHEIDRELDLAGEHTGPLPATIDCHYHHEQPGWRLYELPEGLWDDYCQMCPRCRQQSKPRGQHDF